VNRRVLVSPKHSAISERSHHSPHLISSDLISSEVDALRLVAATANWVVRSSPRRITASDSIGSISCGFVVIRCTTNLSNVV